MMAGSNDNATEMLIQAIDSLQATRYTSAAATTIYLYNIFLTLDLEVRVHLTVQASFIQTNDNSSNTSGSVSPLTCLCYFT
jgi:hypothetical protein